MTPFPLDGGRAGDGGAPRDGSRKSHEAASRHVPGAISHARRLHREMTLAEKVLWRELRKLDLNIRRQAPIGRYVADFIHHRSRLVVEVDSARHDLPENELHDAERTARLQSQGYRVLRFRNGEVVNDPDRVVAVIAAAVAGAPPAPSGATAVRSPPSPALPPSRGKGEVL